MYISIKSEIDSRVVLYPLIKAIWNYGSIAIISSNRQLRRLIDSDAAQGFRNVTVIIDEDGATDDIYTQHGIAKGDYDFVILDNMGVVDYDACIVALGSRHSEEFDEDVKFMLEEDAEKKLWIIQFGRPVGNNKHVTERRSQKSRSSEKDYDPAKKFHDKVKDDKVNQDKLRIVNSKFPSYENIELVEGERKLPEVDHSMIHVFYEILKPVLNVSENHFRKEARKKDESSGDIRRRNTVGQE